MKKMMRFCLVLSLTLSMLLINLKEVSASTITTVSSTSINSETIEEKEFDRQLGKSMEKIIGNSTKLSSWQEKSIAHILSELAFNRHTQIVWNGIGWGTTSTSGPDGYKKAESLEWWNSVPKTRKKITVKNNGYLLSYTTLKADYIDNHSNKTVVIQHGYRGPVTGISVYAKLFYDMGYNVLAPHARGTGDSDGLYINFGWREKDDIVKWIETLPTTNEVVLMGESMGAATMMMASGNANLPKNVKAVIEDCGYTSLEQQMEFLFNKANSLVDGKLPASILDYVYDEVEDKLKISVKDVSALNQVKNSTVPMLFIHGEKDSFVNSEFVYELYHAKGIGYKDLYVVPGADHTQSISYGFDGYQAKITEFLNIIE